MFSCLVPSLISFHISCLPSDGGRSSVEFRGPEESDELDYLPAKHDWLLLLADATRASVTRWHLILKDQRWTVSESDALLSSCLCVGQRHRLQMFVESVKCFPVWGSSETFQLCPEERNEDCFIILWSLHECEQLLNQHVKQHWNISLHYTEKNQHIQSVHTNQSITQLSHTQKSLVNISEQSAFSCRAAHTWNTIQN